MSSPPAVPPEDPQKISMTTPSSGENTSSTTDTFPSTDTTQQQSYAENEGGHIFPEAVPNHNNDTKLGLLGVGDDSEKIVHRTSQTYPEVSYSEFSQKGSLPQHYEANNNYPQPYNENAPEVVHRDSSPPYAVEEKKPAKTICGIRALWFWVILAIIIIIVIIAAVVGGVVGSRASKSEPSTTFLPTAALAAVNYTSGDGVSHYRVYFQAKSNALYQSAWNSSSQEWLVSPLNPGNAAGPEIKPGTPLAAYTLGDGVHTTVEFHVFFLDNENKIWERGTKDPSDMWGTQTDNAMNGTLFAGNDSKLAAYGQQCNNFCAQTSIMTYQNYNYSLWWAAYIQNYGWYAQAVNADQNHTLVQGSSMSLSPIWTNDTSTVVIFSLGYTGNNDSMTDIEVMVNEPGTSGGVSVWDSNFSRSTLSANTVAASAFPSDFNISSIAASAGGRVYAIEEGKIVEWEWQHDNRTFTRIGTVNTDITT
ncbi:Fungal fucose-specific lectin [Lasiodiplodia theobromae]|nr:Fungal fucose-specific lectin [Lasiodiplodia theobromae]